MQISHAITRFEIAHTGAHTNHNAGGFNAQTRWKLGHRIAATAVLDVDVIDTYAHVLNQCLIGLGLWAVMGLVGEHFCATRLVKHHRQGRLGHGENSKCFEHFKKKIKKTPGKSRVFEVRYRIIALAK
jgi:hypothetical protein